VFPVSADLPISLPEGAFAAALLLDGATAEFDCACAARAGVIIKSAATSPTDVIRINAQTPVLIGGSTAGLAKRLRRDWKL